jgi:hypothetical protein
MAQNDPKSPWSDDQIQSTTGGPADAGPWRVTLTVVVILALLLVVGFLVWRTPSPTRTPPAPSPATAR